MKLLPLPIILGLHLSAACSSATLKVDLAPAEDAGAGGGPVDEVDAESMDAGDENRESDGADAPLDPFGVAPRCSSEVLWNPNFQEGPDMFPGRICVACHAAENAASGDADAPLFAVAGTVFPTAHEPDDCRALASNGARVEIVDAVGTLFVEEVNESGNFFSEAAVVYPYRASVVFEGRRRSMSTPQGTSDCNACHTESGALGAPGRIVLP